MKKLFENWNSWVIGESSDMSTVVNGGQIDLYHYSKAEHPTLMLDPKRFVSGRNSWSRREYNISPFPRVFFYADNTKTEAGIALGTPHEVSVPASDLYDLVSDPDGILKRAIMQYASTPDMHKVLKALAGKDMPSKSNPELFTPIREPGAPLYKGVFYLIDNGRIPVVAWFEEISATRKTEESEREEI